ncbi:MAG: uridylate kinase [Candidatus Azotimanducaceae bacterium]
MYSADPNIDETATKFDHLTYDEVLERQLGVMDLTAICLARDQDMPLRVFNMENSGALRNAVVSEDEGTLVTSDKERSSAS